MINLEWLRTFRAVYTTKSLSKAAKILMVSQPTVSQQISALETRVGKKLFDRKSKGVIETDMGRILNTMIAGSLENLEVVEQQIIKKDADLKNIINIGISPHLYKSMLSNEILDLGPFVHIKFGPREELIREVESGDLLYAIVPNLVENFDTTCHPLLSQRLVVVGTPDIDLTDLTTLFKKDKALAEQWLQKHKWYAHEHNSNFIKLYWLLVFDKKRPPIVPNYVIPNEHEVLQQQSRGTGLSIAYNTTVQPYIENGSLHFTELIKCRPREIFLIANKKKSTPQMTQKLQSIFIKKEHSI
ncbi:MAG: LysR family transcriptional regulator [Reichenbachiella sp.]